MSHRRTARLNQQIKREISRILRSEVRDPRVGFPIVTEVDVTADLWLARIYVRPDPTLSEDAVDEAWFEGLEAAAPFIRRELGKTLKVRRIPELRFLPDRTLEHALRIERILEDVLPEGEETDAGGEEETPPSDPDAGLPEEADDGEADR